MAIPIDEYDYLVCEMRSYNECMPKKSGGLEEALSGESSPPPPAPSLSPLPTAMPNNTSITADKLDVIIGFLTRAEKRDRLRTYGGAIKNIIALLPVIFVILSGWYFYKNADTIIQSISDRAVKSAAEYNQKSMMDQLQQYMKAGKKPTSAQ